MDWFCYHVETIDNLKVQALSDKLFRFWIGLLCLCRMHGGELPSTKEIAFRLRLTENRAAFQIKELIDARLIDLCDSTLKPHDWNDWQPKSDAGAAERMRNFRQRRGVTLRHPLRNVTPIEGEGEGNKSNTEKESDTARVTARAFDDWFEGQFWPQYWRNTAKASGKKALSKHATSNEARARILAAMLAQKPGYMRRDTEKRPYLSTWANQERFNDEPELFDNGTAHKMSHAEERDQIFMQLVEDHVDADSKKRLG